MRSVQDNFRGLSLVITPGKSIGGKGKFVVQFSTVARPYLRSKVILVTLPSWIPFRF